MTMTCGTPSRHGYTLLELTAVVVLMAMVTAAVVPGLARRSDESARTQLVAGLIELDARARLNASRNDACLVSIDEDADQILLTILRGKESIVLDQVQIPDGVLVSLSAEGTAIGFDYAGHSDAYGYEIVMDNRITRIGFNGLTGWYEIEDGGVD